MTGPDKISISVLVCSHNPKPEYLARVLAALRAQSLNQESWELLLIDNASTPPLADVHRLDWHPRARHLREDRIGKLNALLLGFKESAGQIYVIVDDDNVLAPDYLENVLAIAAANPRLGAWGGNVELMFEETPPRWTMRYWDFLAQQTVTEDVKYKPGDPWDALPVGAGCCVRKEVVDHYLAQIKKSDWRQKLGRTGNSLISGEDTDLALTAVDLGMGCGLFKSLYLEHLIPPRRLTEEYLLRLVEGIQFSSYVMQMTRDPDHPPPRVNLKWRLSFYAACILRFGRKRRFFIANKNAQRKAREVYDSLHSQPGPAG